MASLLGFLPYLAFLACPLMMVFCVVGMRKMGCSTDARPVDAAADARQRSGPEQVAALQAQLARLQSEQAAIATQLAEIVTDSPVSARVAPPTYSVAAVAKAQA